MPPEKYNAYSYSCTGEFFALGSRVQGELATFKQGDHVGFLCDLVDRRIQFYLNGKLVGAISSLASHIEYTPFVILGEGPFQVSINKVPTIAKVVCCRVLVVWVLLWRLLHDSYAYSSVVLGIESSL